MACLAIPLPLNHIVSEKPSMHFSLDVHQKRGSETKDPTGHGELI